MEQIVCPIDGRACERDCPDRYVDRAEGGCYLTTAREMGAKIVYLGGDAFGALFPARVAQNPGVTIW